MDERPCCQSEHEWPLGDRHGMIVIERSIEGADFEQNPIALNRNDLTTGQRLGKFETENAFGRIVAH